MDKILKKILIWLFTALPLVFWYVKAQAPDYANNFSNSLKEDNSVITIEWVSTDKSLHKNIRCIFYPNTSIYWVEGCPNTYWWQLWNVFKYLWYALLVLFIVIAWVKLLINWGNADKVKQSLSSILYIMLWSVLFFWCVWILWTVLKVWGNSSVMGVSWENWLINNIHWDEGSLLFIVLSFAKTLAFIAAILMIVVHGFKIMSTADKSDKVKIWLKWLLNVIIALVIIKIIDYVYYMAQLSDLVTKATDLIIEVAKILWFIVWALMMIMLFYAGFLFITDQWNGEKMKKAANIILWILVTALVIFALLLIIYEVFNEFA